MPRRATRAGRRGAATLPAGRYAYCGSAWGPGGLKARIGRHLRAAKPLHWHIDQLTAAGRVLEVLARPGERECGLVARLAALAGSGFPLPGFGSSDCRRCPAHLLSLPPQPVALRQILSDR